MIKTVTKQAYRYYFMMVYLKLVVPSRQRVGFLIEKRLYRLTLRWARLSSVAVDRIALKY